MTKTYNVVTDVTKVGNDAIQEEAQRQAVALSTMLDYSPAAENAILPDIGDPMLDRATQEMEESDAELQALVDELEHSDAGNPSVLWWRQLKQRRPQIFRNG